MGEWLVYPFAGTTFVGVIASMLVLREAWRDRVALKRLGINSVSEMMVVSGFIGQLIRAATTWGAFVVFGAIIALDPGTIRGLAVITGTTIVVVGLAVDGIYDLYQRRRMLHKMGTPTR